MSCGCGNTSGSQPSGNGYLLVQATGLGANACLDPESPSATSDDCAKTEPEHDTLLTGFIVPLLSSSATAQVCNSSVYWLGQWIETLSPFCIFQITGIADGSISLRPSLPDGSEINVNPAPGTQIPAGTKFVVRGRPQTINSSEILSAFDEAEEIPVDSLIDTSDTAEVRFVGATIADPGDSSFTKALRLIKGLYSKAKKLYIDASPSRVEAGANHHFLIRNATTGEILEAENLSESEDVEAGKQYVESVTSAGAELIQTWIPYIRSSVLTLAEDDDMPEGTANLDLVISDTEIVNVTKRLDHYWAEIDVYYFVGGTVSFLSQTVQINDVVVDEFFTNSGNPGWTRQKHLTKIMVDDNALNVKIIDNSGSGVTKKYKIRLQKIYR